MLPMQLAASGFGDTPPPVFRCFINIKDAFTAHYGQQPRGMAEMLKLLKLPLEGKHHSGIDDCRNIARCAVAMLRDGCEMSVTVSETEWTQFQIKQKLKKQSKQTESSAAGGGGGRGRGGRGSGRGRGRGRGGRGGRGGGGTATDSQSSSH